MVFNLAPSTSAPTDQPPSPPAVTPLPRRRKEAFDKGGDSCQQECAASDVWNATQGESDGAPHRAQSIGNLALSFTADVGRHLANGISVVAEETYMMAKRVAQRGWDQLNAQLRQRGICLTEEEEENVKTVLLLLLMIVVAIFLLGLGQRRLDNQWELHYN